MFYIWYRICIVCIRNSQIIYTRDLFICTQRALLKLLCLSLRRLYLETVLISCK